MSERIYKQQEELAKLIERYSGRDGVHATAIPWVCQIFCVNSFNRLLPEERKFI